MVKKGFLIVVCVGLALFSLSGCVTTDVAGPVDGGLSYGSHTDKSLFSVKTNLQKVRIVDIEDISGDLKAIATFTPVAVEGNWVVGNYQVVKLFGCIRYQKAAKVKKDLFKDPQV